MKYSVEYSIKSTLQSSTLQSNTHYIRKPLRLRTANCAPQTGHRTPMRDGRRGQGPGESPQQHRPCHSATRQPPPCHTRRPARMSIRCIEKRCEGPCRGMLTAVPRNAYTPRCPFPVAHCWHISGASARVPTRSPRGLWPVRCCGRSAVRPAVRRDEPPTALRARLCTGSFCAHRFPPRAALPCGMAAPTALSLRWLILVARGRRLYQYSVGILWLCCVQLLFILNSASNHHSCYDRDA